MLIDLNDYVDTYSREMKILVYQGMQILITLEGSGKDCSVNGFTPVSDKYLFSVTCTQTKAYKLIEDIENALVYNKADHPQMFL